MMHFVLVLTLVAVIVLGTQVIVMESRFNRLEDELNDLRVCLHETLVVVGELNEVVPDE